MPVAADEFSRILTFLLPALQLLCSGLLHRSGQSGSHHGEHRLRQAGGHKLRRANSAGVLSAPQRRTRGSPAPTNQADGAHLTSAASTNPLRLRGRSLQLPSVSPSWGVSKPRASLRCLVWVRNKKTTEGFFCTYYLVWSRNKLALSQRLKHSKVRVRKHQRCFEKKLEMKIFERLSGPQLWKYHRHFTLKLKWISEFFWSVFSAHYPGICWKRKQKSRDFQGDCYFFFFFYISKLFFANSVAHCWMTVENAFQEKIQVTSMQRNFSQWDCTTLLQLNHCPDCAENHSEDQSEEVELSLSLRKASCVQNASGTRCIDFKPTQTTLL